MSKTSIGLVDFAKKAKDEKWYYVNATYGQIISQSILNSAAFRFPLTYTKEYFDKTIAGRTDGGAETVFGHRGLDCVGLLKAYLWWIDDTKNPNYVGSQDFNVEKTYEKAVEKGILDATHTLPEIIGLLVFKAGHVGIYIGNGKVIEAKGVAFGVVETNFVDGGWTKWAKYLFVDYIMITSNQISEPTRLLSFGSTGNDVRWVEEKLKALNYNVGEINGVFDKVLDTAVRQFQADNKIEVDGIVGKNTIRFIKTPLVIVSIPVPIVVSNPYPRPSLLSIYKWGSVGQEVRWIQYQLFKFGYLKINDVDGIYKDDTQGALKKFQLDRVITSDGIFGQNSNKQLVLPKPVSTPVVVPVVAWSNPYMKPDVTKIYKAGYAGEQVKWIKAVLIRNGFLVQNPITLVFDNATTNAVLEFQRKYRLMVDGKVGKDTIDALQAVNK